MHNKISAVRDLISPCLIAVSIVVAAFGAPAAVAQNASLIDKLSGNPAAPVSPDEAFSVKARRVDATRLAVEFSVRPGYYLYKERLAMTLKDTPGVRITRIDYPPASTKVDKTFGRSEVFSKPFAVTVQLDGNTKGAITAVAKYQGCYEAIGVCYPPEAKTVTVPAHR